MTALMVVYMDMIDPSWTREYFSVVPSLLADHGARSVAAGLTVERVEGERNAPQRMAIIEFPSMDAVHAFMDDPRYAPYRRAREAGARAEIFAFDNLVRGGELV